MRGRHVPGPGGNSHRGGLPRAGRVGRADQARPAPKDVGRKDHRAGRRKLHGEHHAPGAEALDPFGIPVGEGAAAGRHRFGRAVPAAGRGPPAEGRVPGQAEGAPRGRRGVRQRRMRTLHAEGNRIVHRRRGARPAFRDDRRARLRQAGQSRGTGRGAGDSARGGVPGGVRLAHLRTRAKSFGRKSNGASLRRFPTRRRKKTNPPARPPSPARTRSCRKYSAIRDGRTGCRYCRRRRRSWRNS